MDKCQGRKECEEQLAETRTINIYVETIFVNIFMGYKNREKGY